jgi:hypothetical protein
MALLQQQLKNDGGYSPKIRWLLEAGTRGLDPVAEREIYRLMISVRAQLTAQGMATDQIQVLMNRNRSPLEMPGAKTGLRSGDLSMILRRDGSAPRAP